ncbi:Indoleamine 2,3-dioxygenase [Cyathus striatus]|nr:Indoleamine 2,3-dioxygenase [Cyathus striatus]
MDFVNLLPSPPQFFRLFLKVSLSLIYSNISSGYRRTSRLIEWSQSSFDIDPRTGFFPRQPLPELTQEFGIWEKAFADAMGNLSLGEDRSEEALSRRSYGEIWRSIIESWPVLDTSALRDDLRSSQRAHMVLAWLVNLYVHSIPLSDDSTSAPKRVPKSLAVPLVQISGFLGFAPVLTFADTVLWNCEPRDPEQPLSIDNMRFINLFSGTDDERNFYIASAKAELRGVEMLRIIDDFYSIPSTGDLNAISKISRELCRLASIIDDISGVIQSVRRHCNPHVFYWDIRPWFEGSDSRGPSGPGWIYEGIENSSELDLSGPSAGQSSVMHALDVFLDIDHKLHQKRNPKPSAENKRADRGFMERMRRYMPGKHREYLSYLSAHPRSVRELAKSIPALREPYDAAVMALKRLRDSHIRIACLPHSSSRGSGNGPVRGTGGNELSVLLKAGRDATRRAILKDN